MPIFTVTFKDVRTPPRLNTESIDVEAGSEYDSIPIAQELFFTKYPLEKLKDFWVDSHKNDHGH